MCVCVCVCEREREREGVSVVGLIEISQGVSNAAGLYSRPSTTSTGTPRVSGSGRCTCGSRWCGCRGSSSSGWRASSCSTSCITSSCCRSSDYSSSRSSDDLSDQLPQPRLVCALNRRHLFTHVQELEGGHGLDVEARGGGATLVYIHLDKHRLTP